MEKRSVDLRKSACGLGATPLYAPSYSGRPTLFFREPQIRRTKSNPHFAFPRSYGPFSESPENLFVGRVGLDSGPSQPYIFVSIRPSTVRKSPPHYYSEKRLAGGGWSLAETPTRALSFGMSGSTGFGGS